MLCATCRSIFESSYANSGSVGQGKHHLSRSDLIGAATGNCPICSAILRGQRGFLPGTSKAQGEFIHFEFDKYAQESFMMSKFTILRFTIPKAKSPEHEFMLVPLNQIPNSTIFSANERSLNSSVGSRSIHAADSLRDHNVMRLAFFWLRACLKTHTSCRSAHQDLEFSESEGNEATDIHSKRVQWFPKRLLEIWKDNIRLIETDEEMPAGSYATLTHCWGKDPTFHTLTAGNLSEMKAKILPCMLAQTFQDAIGVCAYLGIRYLWIDSLCILQQGEGSTEDWRHHAIAMRKIYICGIINISADRASSANDGFLGRRNHHLVAPTIISYNGSLHQAVDLEMARLNLAESPTAKRAWILQERLLSPRVLHFTEQQLFWECCSLRLACETFPSGTPELHAQKTKNLAPFNIGELDQTYLDSTASHRQRVLVSWYHILEDYSSRQVSMPSKDKFFALAGVVEHIQQELSDEYIAGIFRSELPLGLLWFVLPSASEDRNQLPLDHTYRAPTWSWASLDKAVSFQWLLNSIASGNRETVTVRAEVLEATAALVDKDGLFGQISDARLVLRAPVLKIRWDLSNHIDHGFRDPVSLELIRADNSSFSPPFEVQGSLDRPEIWSKSPTGAIALFLAEDSQRFAFFRDAGLLLIADPGVYGQKYYRVGLWINEREDQRFLDAVQTRDTIIVTIL